MTALLEDMPVHPPQVLGGPGIGVDVDRRFHQGVESAYLVEPERVIDVTVGEEDRVAPA
jgi:hypothetical protein